MRFRKRICFLVLTLSLIVPQALGCPIQELTFDQSLISLRNTNHSFDLDKIQSELGMGFFRLQDEGTAFYAVDASDARLLAFEDQLLFQFKDVKTLHDINHEMNLTDEEAQVFQEMQEKKTRDACKNNLVWMNQIDASSLNDTDINQICNLIGLGKTIAYVKRNGPSEARADCVQYGRINFTECSEIISLGIYGATISTPPCYASCINQTNWRQILSCAKECEKAANQVSIGDGCRSSLNHCKDEMLNKPHWLILESTCYIQEGKIKCYSCPTSELVAQEILEPDDRRDFRELLGLMPGTSSVKNQSSIQQNPDDSSEGLSLTTIAVAVAALVILAALILIFNQKRKAKRFEEEFFEE